MFVGTGVAAYAVVCPFYLCGAYAARVGWSGIQLNVPREEEEESLELGVTFGAATIGSRDKAPLSGSREKVVRFGGAGRLAVQRRARRTGLDRISYL